MRIRTLNSVRTAAFSAVGPSNRTAAKITKRQRHRRKNLLCLLCFFVAKESLCCDAEDAPQSVIKLEGRLRSVEVITRDLTRSAGAVHWNYVHVIRRAVTLLGALPLRERIVADLGRVVDVWLLLPTVTMNLEHVVARVTICIEHAEANRRSGLGCEHWRHRIAVNLCVRQRVREVKRTCLLERRIGLIAHPLPHWLGAIVEGLLTGVFSILFSRDVRHCGRITLQITTTQVDVGLELKDEFTERSAVSLAHGRLRTRVRVFNPGRALRLDDKRTDRALVRVLDRIG